MDLNNIYASKLNFLDDRSVVQYMFVHVSTISDEIFAEIKESLSRKRKILTIDQEIKPADKSLDLGFYVDFKFKLSLHLIETFEARVDWVKKLTSKNRKKLKVNFLEQLIKTEKTLETDEAEVRSELTGFFGKKGHIIVTPSPENIFHFDSVSKSTIAILKQANWRHSSGPFLYI